MTINKITIFVLSFSLLAACKRDPDPSPIDEGGLEVPSTYNFTNVDISGQQTRMGMLSEMVTLMKTGNTPLTVVSASTLKNMYRNQNSPFTDANFNSTTKNLISKTFYLDTTYYLAYMDSLEMASMSTATGSNGVAGVVTSTTDNTKKYLFNERGVEITQLLEKGLMGGVFYYQSMAYYLSDDQIGNTVDNTTVSTGQGTAMEHHWDEAFGYFGAPNDFPTNTTGLLYWAKYSNSVDPVLFINGTIMNAFLTGRAAISAGDMNAKFTQRDIIRANWEKVCAAVVIHYFNEALVNIADDALRNHTLTEAVAFLRNLKYSPVKVITNSEISQIENMIGNNFYNVTIGGINNAKDALSTIYNLDAVKNNL